jgi:hypothetical protein
MDEPVDKYQWIDRAKQRGLGGALNIMFDALEPIGPLGAQILWVIQPVSGLFGWRGAIGALAESLEDPDGVEMMRRRLNDHPAE